MSCVWKVSKAMPMKAPTGETIHKMITNDIEIEADKGDSQAY